jgi:hypothetical protein
LITMIMAAKILAVAALAVGPGPVNTTVPVGAHRAGLSISPNRAGARNAVVLRAGPSLRGAAVRVRFTMLAMAMGPLSFGLAERSPGTFAYTGPAMTMRGLWRLTFDVRPRSGRRLTVVVDDRVG